MPSAAYGKFSGCSRRPVPSPRPLPTDHQRVSRGSRSPQPDPRPQVAHYRALGVASCSTLRLMVQNGLRWRERRTGTNRASPGCPTLVTRNLSAPLRGDPHRPPTPPRGPGVLSKVTRIQELPWRGRAGHSPSWRAAGCRQDRGWMDRSAEGSARGAGVGLPLMGAGGSPARGQLTPACAYRMKGGWREQDPRLVLSAAVASQRCTNGKRVAVAPINVGFPRGQCRFTRLLFLCLSEPVAGLHPRARTLLSPEGWPQATDPGFPFPKVKDPGGTSMIFLKLLYTFISFILLLCPCFL